MKNSKTAIRELTARYRSVLLKGVAIALTMSLAQGAMAVDIGFKTTNDVGLDSYTIKAGDNTTITKGSGYTYTIDTDMNALKASMNKLIVNGTDYEYQDKDGNTVYLTVDGNPNPSATKESYVGTSAVDGTNVTTTQEIKQHATQAESNYKYASTELDLVSGTNAFKFDENGNVKVTSKTTTVYDSSATEDHVSGTYKLANKATGTADVLTITSASDVATINATTYDVKIGSTVYHLSADATKLLDTSDNDVTASFATEHATLKAAYDQDVANVNTAKKAVDAAYKKNTDNFTATGAAYGKDTTTIRNLSDRYDTLDDTDGTSALELYTAAKTTYENSLGQAIDNHIVDSLNDEGTGIIYNYANAIFTEKQEWVDKTLGIDSSKATAVKDALTGEYAGEATTFAEAINVLDAGLVEERDERIQADKDIRADFAAADAKTLADAKAYTDAGFNKLNNKINKLEDRMEKGLAASAALAGLNPLSSEHKTQLSAAMGGYGSNQAVAVGAFHYVNDRTLLNLGGAYAGNTDFSYKVGVTFGF